jgi:hypothetical protein
LKEWIELERDGEAFNKMKNLKTLLIDDLGCSDGSPEHRSNSRRLLDGGGSHFTGGMVFPSKASVIVWFCLGRKIN